MHIKHTILAGGLIAGLLASATPAIAAMSEKDLLDLIHQQSALIKNLESRLDRLEQKREVAPPSPVAKMAPPVTAAPAMAMAQKAQSEYSINLRGRLQVDAVAFSESEGGRDFNSGTAFRRARIGVYGDITKDFSYQVLLDFADGNRIKFDDTFIQYKGWELAKITLGQHKVYHSLNSATSDIHVTFMERSIVSNAFEAGAGGKIGVSAFSNGDNWTFHLGLMTDAADKTKINNDGWGINSRATYAPYIADGRAIHLGGSLYYREESEGTVRFADKPEIRVDNTSLVDSNKVSLVDSEALMMDHYWVMGLEAAGVWGPFTIQSDYIRAEVSGSGGMADTSFWGISTSVSYLLTGESRNYQPSKGAFGRLKPKTTIRNGMGAWEIAARYSYLDLEDQGYGNRMKNITFGLNWIPTDHLLFRINYVHFDVDGGLVQDKGHAIGFRAQTDW